MSMNNLTDLVPNDVHLNPIYNIYILIGLLILAYGLTSYLATKLFINQASFAIAMGIIVGPYGFALIDSREYFPELVIILQEISRAIVGLCCLNVGMELPRYHYSLI
jgi:NhaP-type Na+/H+ or K+/H+ antiporter